MAPERKGQSLSSLTEAHNFVEVEHKTCHSTCFTPALLKLLILTSSSPEELLQSHKTPRYSDALSFDHGERGDTLPSMAFREVFDLVCRLQVTYRVVLWRSSRHLDRQVFSMSSMKFWNDAPTRFKNSSWPLRY